VRRRESGADELAHNQNQNGAPRHVPKLFSSDLLPA
jgi:hypothetical protein